MSAYDRWLEKPYTDHAREQERYEAYCKENDLDPDDEESSRDYERNVSEEDLMDEEPPDFDDYYYGDRE